MIAQILSLFQQGSNGQPVAITTSADRGYSWKASRSAPTRVIFFILYVRIPRIPATQSMGRLPLNPREACHSIHTIPATQST